MAGFAIEDACLKWASDTLPVGQVMILFGIGGALLFAGLAVAQKIRLFTPAVRSPVMLIRAVFEFTGRLFYVLAISLTPLSSATVILQATPLVVVSAAALVFGERVGWRRWTAVALGLVGVIVIIGPGTDSFSYLSVLAVIGMLGFAGRDLASRAAPASLGTVELGFYGFLTIIAAGTIYALWQGDPFLLPSNGQTLAVAMAVLAGVVAYSSLMKAMRTGDVSAVTPFRYTRLLFGIALGLLLFDEKITMPIIAGSGLIVLSGLFILWRARRTE